MDTIEYKGYSIKIERDFDPQNPRDEFDHMGSMVCWHNRYNLGDSPVMYGNKDKPQFSDPSDFQDWVYEHESIVLPLFLYDHSGITMSAGRRGYPFTDLRDTSAVGYIYATLEDVREEYKVKRVSAALRSKVTDLLISEVKEYNQFLVGDVWGFTITLNGEFIDSCWGYYGYKYCEEEAKSVIDWRVNQVESGQWEALATAERVYHE